MGDLPPEVPSHPPARSEEQKEERKRTAKMELFRLIEQADLIDQVRLQPPAPGSNLAEFISMSTYWCACNPLPLANATALARQKLS